MKSIAIAIMTITALPAIAANPLSYPKAPKADVVDTYFGIEVADPYRPLENDTAANTLQWVEEQRALTSDYFSKIPFHDRLAREIAGFQNYRKTGLPFYGYDNKIYFYENDGLKNQAVLYRRDSIGAPAQVFLDPNTLSTDGTVALTGIYMSPSGRYTAYTVSRSGSDWTEIYLLDTATGQLLDDHIEWAKFTGASWHGDDGFFYSAYPKPEDGKEFSNANEYQRVMYHKVGTPQSADTLFYHDLNNPLHFQSAWVPKKSDYIFLFTGGQGFGQEIRVKDLNNPEANWIVMHDNQNEVVEPIDVRDGFVYFTTSIDAPNYKLMRAPVTAPSRENWQEVIAERPDAVLSSVSFTPNYMVITYDKDASSHLYLYSLAGEMLDEIKLPTLGSIGLSVDDERDDFFYSFVTYTAPWKHFAYDPATRTSTLIDQAVINGFNPDDYITREVFYPSAEDGTPVHMFLTYRKDLKPDGNNPVYLYGYGGFNVPLTPGFSPNRLLWLENGGIYAETNLRGGSEYGDKWHEAGTKMQKLNVFNDFIGAAEYLIKEGWTRPELLTIEGGSNGGLLVGATVNMRPDLFAVAIPRVGVMDMMRYHLFTIGWNWASDYGTSADSPEMAAYLRAYSPAHNIKNDGTRYPAILVTTADHDDRVVPAHSFKYAAALQAADTGDAPKLIRIDSKAGHGAGKPVSKIIEEYADLYSFIFFNLGIDPKTSAE